MNAGFNAESGRIFEKALERKFRERGLQYGTSGVCLEPVYDGSLRDDAWRVESGNGAVKVTAGGISGLFAGTGAWLRHCTFDGAGGFVPYEGKLSLTPQNPIHGIYFASHFGNYYEKAPAEELNEYLEDLAFGGCNALMAWYDMHQYENAAVPESRRMITLLSGLYRHASAVGMKTVFGTLANEGFASSPEKMRAEWWVQNGYTRAPNGHYHVEICPNKDGGMEEILKERREVMAAFADTPIDFVSIWDYDQGGCTCEKCKPWGANGFLKCFKELTALYREILPNAKLLCSTWYFDHFIAGEWDAFANEINTGKYDGIDYLFGYFANEEPVPDFMRMGHNPGGHPMIAFPEISMYSASPWGGFGANPLPERLESNFRGMGGMYAGALPYSEGIYEDINKTLMLGFYSGYSDSADEILREYAAFELCLPESRRGDFVRLMHLLEKSIRRSRRVDEAKQAPPYEKMQYVIADPSCVSEAAKLAESLNAAVPERMRGAIRWQTVYLRTKIDLELVKNDMYLSEKQKEYAAELCRLFYADHAESWVSPLTEQSVLG